MARPRLAVDTSERTPRHQPRRGTIRHQAVARLADGWQWPLERTRHADQVPFDALVAPVRSESAARG